MTEYLSKKIKYITLFLMVSVVFLHSYNYTDLWLKPDTYITEGFNIAAMFQYFISNGITRFATPLFYAISGFLFFYTFKATLKGYAYKLKSRFISLVIPFIIWNILAGLFLLTLTNFECTSSLLTVDSYVGSSGYGLSEFYMWFLVSPAFQTWYLQQIILFAVLAPIIYLLIKYTKGIIIIFMVIPWLFSIEYSIGGYFTIYHAEALLFYSIGSYFAIFKREDWILKKPKKSFTVFITVLWLCITLINTIISALDINAFDAATANVLTLIKLALYKVIIALGILVVWCLFDYIVNRIENNKIMTLLAANSFFIFLMHEPLLNVCYQLGLYLGVGNTDFGHLAMFIGFPIAIIALAVLLSMGIKKLCLPLHKALTGNRSNRG